MNLQNSFIPNSIDNPASFVHCSIDSLDSISLTSNKSERNKTEIVKKKVVITKKVITCIATHESVSAWYP